MAHITTLTRAYDDLHNSQANTYSYSGSFETFKESEVKVKLDGTLLTYNSSPSDNTQYSVNLTDKTIHVGGGNLSSGTLSLYPDTDLGAPTLKAPYTAGSAVTASDLTNNQLQVMRKALEFDQNKLSAQGGTMTGHLTMGEDQTIIFEGATDNAHETTLTVTDPTADRTITLPNVTGTVVTTGDTGTVATTMIAADAITGAKIGDDQINSEHYVDASIDNAHIADSAITDAKIQNNAVVSAKIPSSAITTAKIADSAVTDAKIQNNAVVTAKIPDSAITQVKIQDGAINSAKISSNAITTVKISDLNVTTDKIAADAITGAKIADDAVDSEHLAADSIDAEHYAAGSVNTTALGADAVTGAKIADDAINSEHYTDGSIDTAHIADLQVTTVKIAADAVTNAKIADDSIDSEHYVDGSIDTAHIANTQVTDAKLASNSVTTSKITDANVTTDKIANDAITIGKIGCEQTTISDSDSHIPTSGAVVDYVAAQIAPIGGLEVIADEDNFPTSQPASGVVISISDAAGIVVNGSGVSTTARTAGNGSDNVTINNFPSSLYGETLASGVGLMVSSTGSSQTYNYHKILAAETDVKQLSDDINDFNARYRIHAGEPSSNNDDGDLVFDTNANKMKVYDATAGAWTEVTSTGDFKFLVPVDAGTTTAATFDGSDTSFDLKETTNSGSAASVTNINQLIVSLNGVIQKPNTGSYSASEEGFYLTDTDTIRFCTAPATGSTCFIIQCGSAVSIPTPGDGTVTAAKIASGAVEQAKIADGAVNSAKITDGSIVNADINASAAIAGSKIAPAFTSNISITNANPNITFLDSDANSDFKIDVNGGLFSIKDHTNADASRLTIDSSGNIGIGTESPDRTVHCHNSSNTTNVRTKFSNGTTGEGASDGFEIGINASDPAQAVLVNYENSPMAFFTNATERLRIDESGNTHFGSSGTLNDADVVSIVPADGRISFGMDGRSSFVTSESGAYIYSGDGVSGDTIAGDLILQSRSNQDRTIRFVTGSSPAQRLSITNNGLLFGTDTAAANALNDYEEGTFTPAITAGLSAGQVAYNSRSGHYTKIGRIVYFTFHINISSATFDSGGFKFGGLPFTAVNDSNQAGGMFFNYSTGNFGTTHTWKVVGNATDIQAITSAGDAVAANSTSFDTNNRQVSFSGFYRV